MWQPGIAEGVCDPISVKSASERITRTLFGVYAFLIGFSVVGSVLSELTKVDSGAIASVTSFLLVLVGAAVVAIEFGDWPSVFALLAISGLAEIVGVLTGFPFGRYEYSAKWAPVIPIGHGQVFPVLVPLAWLMIVGGCFEVLRGRMQGWRAAVLTATLATIVDLPMERAMVSVFGYWHWLPPGPDFGAPDSNSVGWFAVAFLAIIPGTLSSTGSRQSVYGPWVVALFCAFVATAGLLKTFDWAWVALALLAFCLGIAGRETSGRHPS